MKSVYRGIKKKVSFREKIRTSTLLFLRSVAVRCEFAELRKQLRGVLVTFTSNIISQQILTSHRALEIKQYFQKILRANNYSTRLKKGHLWPKIELMRENSENNLNNHETSLLTIVEIKEISVKTFYTHIAFQG